MAPVFPAETTALTSPAAISPQHREIELSRFFRRASTGFSSMPIDLAGMDDRQAIARGVGHLGQLGLDPLAVTDQHDGQLGLVGDRLACPGRRSDRERNRLPSRPRLRASHHSQFLASIRR